MKPKTMILMVVAVGCGLVASYMTSQLLAERDNTPPPEQQETVKVLVAKNNLELGLLIKDPHLNFKEKPFIKGEEPTKALTDKDYDQLKDRRLVKPLKADEFITAEDLVDKNQNSLAGRLPNDMRAVGIRTAIVDIAGGFASLPMSHVDIISIVRNKDGDSVSQVLLENVLVLAADMATQRADGQNAMPASTVTLALSLQDAELIALAQELGSLKLVLRGYGDNKRTRTEGVHGSDIANGGFRDRDNVVKKHPRSEDSSENATGALVKNVPDVKEEKNAEPTRTSKLPPKTRVLVKNVPDVKEEKKAEPTPTSELPPPPKTRMHVLTIYNGDQGRRYPYRLDHKGRVVTEEISEADPEPPAPPAPRTQTKKPDQPRARVEAPSRGRKQP